jgi:hypothetical protein
VLLEAFCRIALLVGDVMHHLGGAGDEGDAHPLRPVPGMDHVSDHQAAAVADRRAVPGLFAGIDQPRPRATDPSRRQSCCALNVTTIS